MHHRVNNENVTWRVVDDEAVIIHAETAEYFSLNLAGTYLWRLMAQAPCTPDELERQLVDHYDRSSPDAHTDVAAFLDKLAGAQLVVHDATRSNGRDDGRAGVDASDSAAAPRDVYEPPDLVKFGDLDTLILSAE